MKLVYPTIQSHIEIDTTAINSVVVENPAYYYELIKNLKLQSEGENGNWILSHNDSPISINKNVEFIIDFIEFDINKKTILTKVLNALEKTANDEQHLDTTMQLLASIEKYIFLLNEDYDINLECDKITVPQLLKAAGISIHVESDRLIEILYSYMQLIREFVQDKLFIFVNLRNFISENDFKIFTDTIIGHEFMVLFFENKEYPLICKENRLIIDGDLCEL